MQYPGNEPIPRLTKPEPNVIIRLCNGGANGSKAAALTDPINAEFAAVVKGWYDLAGATARLYIWNYVVDFGNPTQSYPNYYAIGISHCRLTIAQTTSPSLANWTFVCNRSGPDIKFFAEHVSRTIIAGLWVDTCRPKVPATTVRTGGSWCVRGRARPCRGGWLRP